MTGPTVRPGGDPASGPRGRGRPSRHEEDCAHVAALAALPGMGAAGLAAILRDRAPMDAWAEVRAGRIERPPRRGGVPPQEVGQEALFRARPAAAAGPSPAPDRVPWMLVARRMDAVGWWQRAVEAGIGVTWPGQPDYPAALARDPEPPGALFWRGRLDVLERPCVAIVGTRQATPNGRSTAYEMARDLVRAGVCVVSGLALGVDGAAHAGAVEAVAGDAAGATVGVAASGVDVPYPRRHSRLWQEVIKAGAVLSENAPGRPAQAWRFPTRNRIIAALSRLVIVVESHECGGSLITAEAAIERGIEVRAVPGPVQSPASAGSNQLLYDGPGPVRDAQDVLDALGLFRPGAPPGRPRRRSGSRPVAAAPAGPAGPAGSAGPGGEGERSDPTRPRLAGADRAVLAAIDWNATSTGRIMARTGFDAATVGRILDELLTTGMVVSEAGWWRRRR
ncbi:MAG TPA: DNA-processing protein DprA [Acidimicrobiales bacterium]|nr:DNA-processing protein DprA [Acidimicrobiales bacterium]